MFPPCFSSGFLKKKNEIEAASKKEAGGDEKHVSFLLGLRNNIFYFLFYKSVHHHIPNIQILNCALLIVINRPVVQGRLTVLISEQNYKLPF